MIEEKKSEPKTIEGQVEAEISVIQFETYNTGDIRALLSFKENEELKKMNFSHLSVPIDETVTENGMLCVAPHDKVFMVFENNNLKYYELRRYTKSMTELPVFCEVCNHPLRKTKNLLRKVKRIYCDNKCECNGHSRAIIFRLLKAAGVEPDIGEVFLNDHYACHITHLWDLILIHKQNSGDPNTEPRQKMWKGRDELWVVEKKLHEFLVNIQALTNKQFWYIGFGIDLDAPQKYEADREYPKVVDDNFHMVKQLSHFFENMKAV